MYLFQSIPKACSSPLIGSRPPRYLQAVDALPTRSKLLLLAIYALFLRTQFLMQPLKFRLIRILKNKNDHCVA